MSSKRKKREGYNKTFTSTKKCFYCGWEFPDYNTGRYACDQHRNWIYSRVTVVYKTIKLLNDRGNKGARIDHNAHAQTLLKGGWLEHVGNNYYRLSEDGVHKAHWYISEYEKRHGATP